MLAFPVPVNVVPEEELSLGVILHPVFALRAATSLYVPAGISERVWETVPLAVLSTYGLVPPPFQLSESHPIAELFVQ